MFEAYFTTLLEELASRGIETAPLERDAPESITPTWLASAIVRALQLTGDPGLGVSYGLRLNLASHGILGYALMSSRNGDQLLSLLTRYAELVMPNLTLTRIVQGDQLLIACDVRQSPLPRGFQLELVLTTLISGARALFNRRIPGAQMWLDFAPPPHAQLYDALKIPVHFARPQAALVCHRDFLDMEISSAHPVMAEIGARQCEDMLAHMRTRSGIAQQIRRILLRARGVFPAQNDMASALHISSRTLRRRLQDAGLTYREIVDEVKFELAQRYLETSELTVGEIAGLLAYEDPANFRRAFKRWSGHSPNGWRTSQRV
jgi:AraC-like DNA-binding protein